MKVKIYCVKELKGGGSIRISKYFPTWLGCKRERNRIHREFPFFRHIVHEEIMDEETAKQLLKKS